MPRSNRSPLDGQVAVLDVLRHARNTLGDAAAAELAKAYLPQAPSLPYSGAEATYGVELGKVLAEGDEEAEFSGDNVRRMANVVADYFRSNPRALTRLFEHAAEARERINEARRGVDLDVLLGPRDEGPANGQAPAAVVTAKRQRRAITDPEVLAKRQQALAKARAARAERLAATRTTT